jgi:DNA-binding PadR family transcriptional regulator
MSIGHRFLGLLEKAPSHGYTLKQEYDESFGQPMKIGQVYATLARLQRDGLVQLAGMEAGGGPERKVYAITPEGLTELETWLSTPEVAQVQPGALFAKVVVALRSGRSAADVLDAQRAVHIARMRELLAQRGDDEVAALAAEYEIAHLQADLDWIELAGTRLRETGKGA